VVFKILGTHSKPNGLQITVQDRGFGFAPKELVPSDLKSKLEQGKRKRGWGLMIIKGLMDEVDIQSDEEGTRIVMRKMR
jgi:anti-sigma regulatory factor (Ser/Thr protein kinase)